VLFPALDALSMAFGLSAGFIPPQPTRNHRAGTSQRLRQPSDPPASRLTCLKICIARVPSPQGP
jgi:hypothetical protein